MVLQGASFWLLPACGVVTSIPLLLFNMGVKEIPYYFAGILMYINPTLQFLMGLLYFREALDLDQLVAFVIIWVGIVFTMAEKGAHPPPGESSGERGRFNPLILIPDEMLSSGIRRAAPGISSMG